MLDRLKNPPPLHPSARELTVGEAMEFKRKVKVLENEFHSKTTPLLETVVTICERESELRKADGSDPEKKRSSYGDMRGAYSLEEELNNK
ncbi:OLC1v1001502C1 [Oldenlandia corymbosa var. corymbosa]|uniref:OLC1v1001502C1 n=1 Tax=Oldenlandia corymbosa var. corymbosa TaxID=529605 RepID=A0AAV1D5N2_OLDCO|nr:OLC1v1001502C1 [Oldenlandia corymbosa var. corymbosa]